jgi:hypothetical protein
MRIRHRLAIVGTLAALCLCPAARAQCDEWLECGSDVAYNYDANMVWADSFTLNWYYHSCPVKYFAPANKSLSINGIADILTENDLN